MAKMFKGVEWCPYCEEENEYCIHKDVWVINCQYCGKPLVLCDKCAGIHGVDNIPCGNCPYSNVK